MKKRKTTSAYATFALLFTVALLSFSSNPPNGRTGAPGEGTCSGCHSSPPAGVQGLVTIEDLPATVMPNTTYTLTVRAEATMGSPATGGFQLVALDDSNVNMGDLMTISSDAGTNTAGTGREYVEHRGDKNITGSDVSWTFNWISPATGSGNVNMWASAILANNNGSTSNDRVLLTSTSAAFMGGGTPPTVSVSTIDIDCFGVNNGSATANPTGGTPPYTYLWSNNAMTQTITNLSAGSYTVTVSDANSLSAVASGTVNEAPPILITLNTVDPNCDGFCDGQIQSTVSGGIGTLSYVWSPGGQTSSNITDLCPGTYTLVVTDANGCSEVAQATIADAPVITVGLSITDTSCNGTCDATATAFPNGFFPPFTYLWSPSAGGQTTATATGLCAGTHQVMVTDANGCTQVESLTINEPSEIILTSSSIEATCGLCNGSASVTATDGTPPYTYLWDINTGSQTTATAVDLCAGTYIVTVSDDNSCSKIETVIVTSPNALILASNVIPTSCFGECNGTATVFPTGGTPPYTYLWDIFANNQTTATAINLCPGTYVVSVTDSDGCLATELVSIIEPDLLVLSRSSTNVTCNGLCDGTATVVATGGTPNYTYEWNDASAQTTATATGLCPGTYTATVTDGNACVSMTTLIITEPAPLTISASSTDVTCNGNCDGTIDLTIAGGSGLYTYLWSDNSSTQMDRSNLCAGSYSVTVTDDNGCSETQTILINEPSQILITSTHTDLLCFDECTGTIDISVSGGSGVYNFIWSDGAANIEDRILLCSGIYALTVQDSEACFAVDSFFINTPPQITGFTTTTDVDCFGECTGSATVNVTGGTGTYTYQWDANANNQFTRTVTNLCPGTYFVTTTDANNCSAVFSATIFQNPLLQINATATGETSAGANDGTASANPSGGTAPYTYLWSNGPTTPTISGLAPGSYTVTVTDSKGCTQMQTVIVNSINCQIIIDITSTDVNCANESTGIATAIATNGTPNYTYTWSNNMTGQTVDNLTAGTYTVTVVDAVDCSATATIIISEPAPIIIDYQKTDATCAGFCDGSITLGIAGGVGGYIYVWDNGLPPIPNPVNVCPGVYNVTVTDQNLCTVVEEIIINEPATIDLSASVTNISCNGSCDGAIDLMVLGGTLPYSFTWQNGTLPGSEDQTGLCPGTYIVTVTDANNCTATLSVPLTEPDLISSIFNITCESMPGANDGAIDAMVSGGLSPYTYLWSNGGTGVQINNLAPGVYMLTVTDENSCTAVFSETVCSVACNLLATVSPIDVNCHGDSTGTAIATVGNGIPPYQFAWSNGSMGNPATGLPAGTYTLTVTDDGGCSATSTFTIAEPSPISAVISPISGISCNGLQDGVASVTPGGGVGPYTIQWSNGGTNSTQNNLPPVGTVRIIDANGCSELFPYTLPEPAPLIIDMSSTPETSLGAMDGTATASPMGGTMPYTYLWNTGGTNPSITGLAPGTYSVVVTDNSGCSASNIVDVNAGGCDLVLESLTTVDILCTGNGLGSATVNVSGGTLPYTYMWSSGGNQSTETGLMAGTYAVSVLDANNCIVSSQFSINETTPINLEIISQTSVDCGGNNTASATVLATGGTMPYAYQWSNGGTMATESGLTNITYMVIVTDANLCMDTVFITIEAEDLTPPVIDPTPPDLNVYLDTLGVFILEENDIAAGASDNCGMVDIFINQDTFDCSMVGNIQTIVYTATDQSGNTASATFDVTVLDTLPPEVIAQDIDLYLGNTGLEFIESSDIIVSASDNCMVDTVLLDRDGFGCPSLGAQTVHFVVFDVNGNCVEDSVVVTVWDTLSPTIICPGDITSNSCDGVVDYFIDFTDNCLLGPPVLVSGLPSGSVFPTGQTLITYEIADMAGNLASCSFTVTVDSIPDLEANIVLLKAPCPGEMDGSLEAIPTGSLAPYSFQWDDPMMQTTAIATNLAAGTYTVEVTGNFGCDTFRMTIDLDASPELVIDVASVVAANNGMPDGSIDVNVSGGIPPYSFLWNNGAMTEDLNAIPPGVYVLEVTDENACVFTSDSIVVDNMTGTINFLSDQSVSLVPNPNNGHFTISLEGEAAGQEWQMDLFDVQGKSVMTSQQQRIDQSLEIRREDLADGVYLFRLQNALGVIVKKVVISRE